MKICCYLLSFLLFSLSSFASDHRLTKEEFLDGVLNDKISLERGPIYAVPPNILAQVSDVQKKTYPNFKPEYLYANYIKDNKYIYTINFDWTQSRCLLRIEELDEKLGKPNAQTLDPVGQQVDTKYCNKAYGMKTF